MKKYPVAFKEIAQRAFKRGMYFMAMRYTYITNLSNLR